MDLLAHDLYYHTIQCVLIKKEQNPLNNDLIWLTLLLKRTIEYRYFFLVHCIFSLIDVLIDFYLTSGGSRVIHAPQKDSATEHKTGRAELPI